MTCPCVVVVGNNDDVMTFGIPQPGVWRYRIERLADSHQSHFVQVVTKTSSEDLTVRLYSNVRENRVANLTQTPLIIFTEVSQAQTSFLRSGEGINLF